MQNLINSSIIQNRVSSAKIRVSNYLTYILSFVLLFAGISKIIDATSLIENLSSLQRSFKTFSFLSDDVIIIVSTLLPILEIAFGLLLILSLNTERLKEKRRTILFIVTLLFMSFLFYTIYGFVIGNQTDCGCFGNAVKSSFGWGIMIRNLIFVLLSIFALFLNNRNFDFF